MPQNKPKLSLHIETISAIFIIIFMAAFVLANFFIGFSLPIYLLAAGIGFILSVFYPRSGFYAIIFLTVIFERFFTLAPVFIYKTEYKFYPIDVLILGMILGIILIFLQSPKEKHLNIKLKNNDWVLIAFIILNVLYFLASILIIKSSAYLAFSTLKNYSFYSLLYFIAWIIIRSREDLERLFRFFLAGGIGIIGFIIFGILNGGGLWTEYTPLSTTGFRILAFTHGLYLSLAIIPLIVHSVFKIKKEVSLFRVIILIWTIGIIGTMMRHLWVSLVLSMLCLYLIFSRENQESFRKLVKKYVIAIVLFLTVAIYIIFMLPNSELSDSAGSISGAVIERGTSIVQASSDESFAWRELVWSAGYKDFKNNPVFGIGTGKTIYVEAHGYQDYVEARDIHNSYLAILIQLGILGFGLLAYFICKNIQVLLKLIRTGLDNFYGFSVLGVLAVYLVAFFFQPYLETNLLSIFFWITLGLSRKIAYENTGNQ